MRKLEQIKDPKALQQTAILLEKSVIKLQRENAKLRMENARLRGQDVDPQMELELLKEQLAAMQKSAYGPSSEKRPKEDSTSSDPKAERQRGHGPRPQPDLPVEEKLHTLAEDGRECAFCGGHLEEMGEQTEDSEEVTVVELAYKVVQHKRQKYRCRCNAQVITAPGPTKLIPGGRYSIDLAVHVAEKKYLDHLPLERQVRAMERRGLYIDSQTLWDQIKALFGHLTPTYEALKARARAAEVIFADETYWKLMAAKNETSRWWVWCTATDDTAAYQILNSRSAKAAARLLGDFNGIAMTDGYGAYQALAKGGGGFQLVHCWAHVRRKFLEAEDAYPDLSTQFVDLIGKLFEVERNAPKPDIHSDDDHQIRALELRASLRQAESKPLLKSLFDLAAEHRGRVLPGSKMGKAIDYMLKLWKGLNAFVDDPRIPLDNNAAERALRGIVVGRKNHYGSRSKAGTEVAALFYTLFESAKLAGVDPAAYVREAAHRAIQNPGTTTLPQEIS